MTAAQFKLLCKVCTTNGGGISAQDANARTIAALLKFGYIQGKSGMQWKIVHTREGLAAFKEFSQ